MSWTHASSSTVIVPLVGPWKLFQPEIVWVDCSPTSNSFIRESISIPQNLWPNRILASTVSTQNLLCCKKLDLIMGLVCMFDKFPLISTSNWSDVLQNKSECQMSYTFYSKLSPQFWITQYFKNLIFWIIKIQSWFITQNLWIEYEYPSVLHVSPNVEDGSPIHCIHWASRAFKFNLFRKWFFIAFLENPLSQIVLLDGIGITFYPSCISLGQFVCNSKLLPKMRQTLSIIMFSHSCRSVSVNSRNSPLHMLFSSSMYLNFNNILSSHNFVFMICSLSLLG